MRAKLNNANKIRLIIGADYIVDIKVSGNKVYHDVKTSSGAIQLTSNYDTPLEYVINKIKNAIADYEHSIEDAQ